MTIKTAYDFVLWAVPRFQRADVTQPVLLAPVAWARRAPAPISVAPAPIAAVLPEPPEPDCRTALIAYH